MNLIKYKNIIKISAKKKLVCKGLTWYFQSISLCIKEKNCIFFLCQRYTISWKSYDMIWERTVLYKWEAKDFIGGKHSLDVSVSKSKKFLLLGYAMSHQSFRVFSSSTYTRICIKQKKKNAALIDILPHNHNIPLWKRIWVVAFKRFCFFLSKMKGKRFKGYTFIVFYGVYVTVIKQGWHWHNVVFYYSFFCLTQKAQTNKRD